MFSVSFQLIMDTLYATISKIKNYLCVLKFRSDNYFGRSISKKTVTKYVL